MIASNLKTDSKVGNYGRFSSPMYYMVKFNERVLIDCYQCDENETIKEGYQKITRAAFDDLLREAQYI